MKPALLAAVALLAAAAPAHAAKRPTCDQRAGRTLVSDGAHRVYVHDVVDKQDADTSDTTVLSCTVGSRKKSRALERNHNTIDGSKFPVDSRLSGRWLLLEDSFQTGTDAGESLRVFDLKTGKTLGGLSEDGADFTDIVITADGAIAYQEQDDPALTGYDNAGFHDLAPAATALGAGGALVYWRNPDMTTGASVLAGPPKKYAVR